MGPPAVIYCFDRDLGNEALLLPAAGLAAETSFLAFLSVALPSVTGSWDLGVV